MVNISTLFVSFLLLPGQDYSRLKDVKAVQYARAPGYSEGPTWKQGELFFCSGALLRVGKEGRIDKFLDINPAGTILKAKLSDARHRINKRPYWEVWIDREIIIGDVNGQLDNVWGS